MQETEEVEGSTLSKGKDPMKENLQVLFEQAFLIDALDTPPEKLQKAERVLQNRYTEELRNPIFLILIDRLIQKEGLNVARGELDPFLQEAQSMVSYPIDFQAFSESSLLALQYGGKDGLGLFMEKYKEVVSVKSPYYVASFTLEVSHSYRVTSVGDDLLFGILESLRDLFLAVGDAEKLWAKLLKLGRGSGSLMRDLRSHIVHSLEVREQMRHYLEALEEYFSTKGLLESLDLLKDLEAGGISKEVAIQAMLAGVMPEQTLEKTAVNISKMEQTIMVEFNPLSPTSKSLFYQEQKEALSLVIGKYSLSDSTINSLKSLEEIVVEALFKTTADDQESYIQEKLGIALLKKFLEKIEEILKKMEEAGALDKQMGQNRMELSLHLEKVSHSVLYL